MATKINCYLRLLFLQLFVAGATSFDNEMICGPGKTDVYRIDQNNNRVVLPSGTCCLSHYMSNTTPISYDFSLVGDNTTIECVPEVTRPIPNDTDYTRFPFVFNGSQTVEIRGVTFQNCLRPLQFVKVEDLTLSETNFR